MIFIFKDDPAIKEAKMQENKIIILSPNIAYPVISFA